MPRLRKGDARAERAGYMKHSQVEEFVMIAREHNRTPGVFDYSFPQTFYSTFPEIDRETYITFGADQSRRLHNYN